MPSEFDSILAGFRRVFVDLGSNRLAVYATYWDRFDGPLGDVCGEIHPIIDGKMKALTLFVKCDHYDIGKQFTVAAANAGAALSSKMRESVQALHRQRVRLVDGCRLEVFGPPSIRTSYSGRTSE